MMRRAPASSASLMSPPVPWSISDTGVVLADPAHQGPRPDARAISMTAVDRRLPATGVERVAEGPVTV